MKIFDVYEQEIIKREQILNKIRNHIKVSPEERTWLLTHSLYNKRWGMDTYNVVIEHLLPAQWFLLKIRIESVSYEKRILPIISVPAGKGQINADFEIRDYNGKIQPKKQIKMLGIEFDTIREYEVDYFSQLGLLAVEYGCDYFDEIVRLHKRESSSTGNPDFAIRRQVVDDHAVRYFCKSPLDESFDALVFSLQWERNNIYANQIHSNENANKAIIVFSLRFAVVLRHSLGDLCRGGGRGRK